MSDHIIDAAQDPSTFPELIEDFMSRNPEIAQRMQNVLIQLNTKQFDILEQIIRLASGLHDIQNGKFGRAQFDTLVKQMEDAGTIQDLSKLLFEIFATAPETNPDSLNDRIISHHRIDLFESAIGKTGKLQEFISNLTREQRTELDEILFAETMTQENPLYAPKRPANWTNEQWETLQIILKVSRKQKGEISVASSRIAATDQPDTESTAMENVALPSTQSDEITVTEKNDHEVCAPRKSPNNVHTLSRLTRRNATVALSSVGTLALVAGLLGMTTEKGQQAVAATTKVMRTSWSAIAAKVIPGNGFDDSEEDIKKQSKTLEESAEKKAQQEWETISKSPMVFCDAMRRVLQEIIKQWGDANSQLSPKTLPYFDALASRIADSLQTSQRVIEDSLRTGNYTTAISQGEHARFLCIEAEIAGVPFPQKLRFDEYQLFDIYAKAIPLLEAELPSLKPTGPKVDSKEWRLYLQREGELHEYYKRLKTLPESHTPSDAIVQR